MYFENVNRLLVCTTCKVGLKYRVLKYLLNILEVDIFNTEEKQINPYLFTLIKNTLHELSQNDMIEITFSNNYE